MIALDTNLLVRLATDDVPADRRAVIALLEREKFFIAKTVLLEAEWVLRSRYGYAPDQVSAFLEYLGALQNAIIEDDAAVRWAIGAMTAGLDFADALHLASAGGERFYTLDAALYRKARRLKGVRIQLLR